jgi:predicted RNA methylase
MGGVTGNLKAPLSERGDDLYETPACAVESLLKVERLPTCVWEPACGPGAIARVLRQHEHFVWATDLVDYASADQDASGWDFLSERVTPPVSPITDVKIKAIVTNPPFKLAGEFVAKALDLCPLVYMLLRLAFMESERRCPILDSGNLARVHVYRKRLPMMHRAGWEGRKANSGMAFAWFVWDANHSGPTELHRISWDR